MKTKIVKLRDRHGIARYEEMTDVAGIIAITRAILRADPTNAKAVAVVKWADDLGHKPTSAEFEAFLRTSGIGFTDASGDVENYTN